MFNLIRADGYKLRKSAAFKWIFAVACTAAAAMTLIAFLIARGTLDAGLSGIGFLFSDVNAITILGAVTAATLVCGDLENRTIHHAVSAGGSRNKIIAAKMAVYGCAVALCLLPYAAVTGVLLGTDSEFDMGAAAVGFLHLLTSDTGGAPGLGKLLVVALTLMLVYAAQLSLCVPLALLVKKPVFVVAFFYGFSILSGQLLALSDRSPAFARVYAWTPYGGSHLFITAETGAAGIVKALLVSLVFIAVMTALAQLIFRRAEIK